MLNEDVNLPGLLSLCSSYISYSYFLRVPVILANLRVNISHNNPNITGSWKKANPHFVFVFVYLSIYLFTYWFYYVYEFFITSFTILFNYCWKNMVFLYIPYHFSSFLWVAL